MITNTDFQTFGFIGLGLIGGSIARAIREKYPASRILVFDADPNTMKLALTSGVASETTGSVNEAFAQCDCVFLCAPVSDNAHNLSLLKEFTPDTCIITDVGSVKTHIHKQVEELQLEDRFIGGHPMAGSERVGFINSKSLLLQNAYYILTPCSGVPEAAVSAFRDLIEAIGSVPLLMDYRKHDFITGAVSHLPHVVSASLVNLIKAEDTPDELMKTIAAGGFKDITRISSSSPVMWQQICLTNKENISILLEHYIKALQNVKKLIDDSTEQEIFDFFKEARDYRDSFVNTSSGPIKKTYAIHVEIADQPGALASVAMLLAENSISIKNIGITHNRERTDGALRIEVYQEESLKQAEELLHENGYLTHLP
jgi:prephenate dehydrogenase